MRTAGTSGVKPIWPTEPAVGSSTDVSWLLFVLCRYELAYIESNPAGVARGQRVWQLAFGSGFKFNSCVLVANKRVQETHTAWKGFDSQVRAAPAGAGLGWLRPDRADCDVFLCSCL
jgi:hypothetical protein